MAATQRDKYLLGQNNEKYLFAKKNVVIGKKQFNPHFVHKFYIFVLIFSQQKRVYLSQYFVLKFKLLCVAALNRPHSRIIDQFCMNNFIYFGEIYLPSHFLIFSRSNYSIKIATEMLSLIQGIATDSDNF